MAHATTRAFADERRSAIMEMLEHNASVQVAEIAQTFGVSSVTARADLDALAESGKLRRTHGGAVSLQKRLTVSTQDRRHQRQCRRQAGHRAKRHRARRQWRHAARRLGHHGARVRPAP